MGGTLAALLLSVSGCSAGAANALQVLSTDETGMTVHDIKDGQPFVSSGIRICTTGKGPVTVTGVAPSGKHEGMSVTGFDTFVATPTSGEVPLSLRGSLRDVTAKSGAAQVADPCSDKSDSTPKTYIGWEVSGKGSGPATAQRFTVSYKDDHGRTGTVDVRVAITLCDQADVAGPCAK